MSTDTRSPLFLAWAVGWILYMLAILAALLSPPLAGLLSTARAPLGKFGIVLAVTPVLGAAASLVALAVAGLLRFVARLAFASRRRRPPVPTAPRKPLNLQEAWALALGVLGGNLVLGSPIVLLGFTVPPGLFEHEDRVGWTVCNLFAGSFLIIVLVGRSWVREATSWVPALGRAWVVTFLPALIAVAVAHVALVTAGPLATREPWTGTAMRIADSLLWAAAYYVPFTWANWYLLWYRPEGS